MSTLRFNDNTKAVRILRDKFLSGESTGEEIPADVRDEYQNYLLFKKW